jgi:hypothetical protein
LFLLTDRGFFVLPNLASRFLRGESLEDNISISTMPTDASDAFLLGSDTVLLLEDSIVTGFEIAELVKGLVNAGSARQGARSPRADRGRSFEVESEISLAHYVPLDAGWEQAAHVDLAVSKVAA